MRYIKNLIIILVCLIVVLSSNIKVFAVENDCNESQELLFSDNEIIVILDHYESLLFKDYDLNFFGDINCIEIEDLTSNYKAKYLE